VRRVDPSVLAFDPMENDGRPWTGRGFRRKSKFVAIGQFADVLYHRPQSRTEFVKMTLPVGVGECRAVAGEGGLVWHGLARYEPGERRDGGNQDPGSRHDHILRVEVKVTFQQFLEHM